MLPKHMHIIYRLDSKTRYIFNHIFKMIPCSDMTNKLFIRLVYGVKMRVTTKLTCFSQKRQYGSTIYYNKTKLQSTPYIHSMTSFNVIHRLCFLIIVYQ